MAPRDPQRASGAARASAITWRWERARPRPWATLLALPAGSSTGGPPWTTRPRRGRWAGPHSTATSRATRRGMRRRTTGASSTRRSRPSLPCSGKGGRLRAPPPLDQAPPALDLPTAPLAPHPPRGMGDPPMAPPMDPPMAPPRPCRHLLPPRHGNRHRHGGSRRRRCHLCASTRPRCPSDRHEVGLSTPPRPRRHGKPHPGSRRRSTRRRGKPHRD
jgi:NAD-dependent dihydropyrimidine dehydrogenase PreA subunit